MDINIVGPKVYWTIDLPFEVPLLGGKIEINETMLISWIVMLIITGLCIFLTRNLKEKYQQTPGCSRMAG